MTVLFDPYAEHLPDFMTHETLCHWIRKWITEFQEERNDPYLFGVVATVDAKGLPFSRTVEVVMSEEAVLLFSSWKGGKKVAHIENDPHMSVTMPFVTPTFRRQIIFRGAVTPLSEEEMKARWQNSSKRGKILNTVWGAEAHSYVENYRPLAEKMDAMLAYYKDEADVDLEPSGTRRTYHLAPQYVELTHNVRSRLSPPAPIFSPERAPGTPVEPVWSAWDLERQGKRWALSRKVPS